MSSSSGSDDGDTLKTAVNAAADAGTAMLPIAGPQAVAVGGPLLQGAKAAFNASTSDTSSDQPTQPQSDDTTTQTQDNPTSNSSSSETPGQPAPPSAAPATVNIINSVGEQKDENQVASADSEQHADTGQRAHEARTSDVTGAAAVMVGGITALVRDVLAEHAPWQFGMIAVVLAAVVWMHHDSVWSKAA